MSFKRIVVLSCVLLASASYAVSPIIPPEKIDTAKAALGKKLFFDKRLSLDNTVSCGSCHLLEQGGVNHDAVSTGIKHRKGPINAPTVYNSAHNFVQFWDGRAKDLAEQAAGPVENPLEMGEAWPNVVKKISAISEYQKMFAALNHTPISKASITDAIAEFEKTLDTPGAPFDAFLRGDKKAISDTAQKGYQLFQEKGCVACHSGDYFGGNSYQRLNPDYFKDRGTPITDADKGRFNITHQETDMHFFKVPMLRNIAVTAPYFHDGQVKTLDEAVTKMAKYQLGQTLKPEEVSAIVAFLQSLTGQYEGKPLNK